MKIIDKTIKAYPVTKAGYSRRMASAWTKSTNRDFVKYKGIYSKKFLKSIHKRGFLGRSVERFDLANSDAKDCITDFEYIFLSPFNNSFTKWVSDILTTRRVLANHGDICRDVFYSIVKRDGHNIIFKVDNETRKYNAEDIIQEVREKGVLELRPTIWTSGKDRYKLSCVENVFQINDNPANIEELEKIIEELKDSYLVAEYIDLQIGIDVPGACNSYIKFYVANDSNLEKRILSCYAYFVQEQVGEEAGLEEKPLEIEIPIDYEDGSFTYGQQFRITNWSQLMSKLEQVAADLEQINYFTICMVSNGDGFKISHINTKPYLPSSNKDERLNVYLREKFRKARANLNVTREKRMNAIKTSLFYKFVRHFCRKGVRPYMQRLWFASVKDDLLHTRLSIFKKIWAWRRGFLSFRIKQYGLTKQNYKNFLSDYDYHWLNRINNDYQKWINDKTTFRYILDPFKEYIPKYYYSIFKHGDKNELLPMKDLPKDAEPTFDGLFKMMEREKKLALKPSSGTHGDGFFCLGYEGGDYQVNGVSMKKEEIIELIENLSSFYIVTEYINMHSQLKKIYPKSVNSVRMMVINREGYNPQIVQAYMRIGSSKTGYTDNVGYGGICVMIDEKDGTLYNPERIVDHNFEPCLAHPDTNTKIEGKVPNWDIVCEKIEAVCRYMPELEYLGFDIAITEDAFNIIEINIHQDLHKTGTHSDTIRNYFKDKIEEKKSLYN